jgi:predicted phage baseplate assembly protein
MSNCGCKGSSCGCCAGVEKLTPAQTANRPGLNSLNYRVGTHATFFETMQARLSAFSWENPVPETAGVFAHGNPLANLKTRSPNDPSIAMLDAAATMLDVLTFYQERIANEGYLRTAAERRSILELGRLVGYKMRPGVSASVYLAYTLDDNSIPIEIAAGALSQSVPAQNEMPQSFETSDKLQARKEWNNLKPRMTRPQKITSANSNIVETIYFEGTETGLKPNDPLLFTDNTIQRPILRRVKTVEPLFEEKKTKVTMQVSLTMLEFVGKIRQIITSYVTNFPSFCLAETDPLVKRGVDHLTDVIRLMDLRAPESKTFFCDGIRMIIDVKNSDDPRIKKWYGGYINDYLKLLHAVQFFDIVSGKLDELLSSKLLSDESKVPPETAEMILGVTELLRGGMNDFEKLGQILEPLWNGTIETIKSLRTIATFDALWRKFLTAFKEIDLSAQLKPILQDFENIEAIAELLASENTEAKSKLILKTAALSKVFTDKFKSVLESDESGAFQKSLKDIDGHDQTFNLFAGPMKGFAGLLKIFRSSTIYAILRRKAPANVPKDFKGVSINAIEESMDQAEKSQDPVTPRFISLVRPLSKSPSIQPANSASLGRRTAEAFGDSKDTIPQVIGSFNPDIRDLTYKGWAGASSASEAPAKIFALRKSASLFGATAPPRTKIQDDGSVIVEGDPFIVEFNANGLSKTHEDERSIYLDASYDSIPKTTWVVVDMSEVKASDLTNFEHYPPRGLVFAKSLGVSSSISRNTYGMSGKSTLIKLDRKWIDFKQQLNQPGPEEFSLIRRTVVHTQSEQLKLAEEPVLYDICGDTIELGALYDGLQSGRWLIVSGERTDIRDTTGIRASELVMLAGVDQKEAPGEKIRSVLKLANRLSYTYKRDTVIIYGNVVKATHGETRREVLGGGDATRSMQAFTLKQPPLTYVSAANSEGIESTLHVRVNDVEWKETDTFAVSKPQDRSFITKTDDDSNTTVIFGNGEKGARPPTGAENITAVYRNGIGKPGNVKAEQITLLMTKPIGLKEVINPIRASGGADKETRDQARRNVPIALLALDRLVSTVDYENFARTFAGIGKASAKKLSDGFRYVVHLTLAGVDDIPIDENSDLYRNLRAALAKNGDPRQAVRLKRRELKALIASVNVRIGPEYLWEKVEPVIRAAMLDTFSFERRELGQSVFLSEIISVIQRVKGVAYVDVDVLNSIEESDLSNAASLTTKLGELRTASAYPKPPYVKAELARDIRDAGGEVIILPAQLAFFLPDVPDTLILNKIEEVKK